MTASNAGGITDWLRAWSAGSATAADKLFDEVYDELRRMARYRLHRDQGVLSVDATELVNELFVKLAEQRRVAWHDRNHFLALSATFLRRILVDHYRRRQRLKRGGGVTALTLQDWDGAKAGEAGKLVDILALHQALNRLERIDSSATRLVELRYFLGLSVTEAAAALGLGRSTATRRWDFARAWLQKEMKAEPAGPPDESTSPAEINDRQ